MSRLLLSSVVITDLKPHNDSTKITWPGQYDLQDTSVTDDGCYITSFMFKHDLALQGQIQHLLVPIEHNNVVISMYI